MFGTRLASKGSAMCKSRDTYLPLLRTRLRPPTTCLCPSPAQAFVHELWSTLKARGQPADEDLTVPAQLMRLR